MPVPATGQVLQDRYQLDQQLSDRPPRQTWLALDLQARTLVPQPVIVKLLTVGAQWDDLKLFEREAQVLNQLHHPRIPRYRDYFQVADPALWVGLVEDYIPGPTLQVLLEQGQRFSQSDIEPIAHQMLQILMDLHRLIPPVLHRDIKPSNIIWTPDQHIYLVDFGAVQDQVPKDGGSFTVVGTYGYTPMEQFGGRAVPASDLYALGATLIHLLTGVAPADLLQPDLIIQFGDRVTLSSDLLAWLQRMTAPDLARRFRSAEQALAALQQCCPDPTVAQPSLAPVLPLPTRVLMQPASGQLKITVAPKWVGQAIAWPERVLGLAVFLGPVLILLPGGIFLVVTSLIPFNFAGLGVGLLLAIAGLVLCLLGLNWLQGNLGATQILLTPTLLRVQRQLWGWTYRHQEWPVVQLQSFYLLSQGPQETAVVFQTKDQEPPHLIGEKLTATEGEWLTQRINDWLLQITPVF